MSTVSQILFVAGGVSDIGSLRNIEIRRDNRIITTFDLYELLTKGKADNDIRLQSGDIVFVPIIKKSTYIDGAVKRPGRYELSESDTIKNLIELAGGYLNLSLIHI